MTGLQVALTAGVVMSVAVAAMAVPQTLLSWDVSADGGASWHSSLDVLPGTTVKFRLRTSLINNTGPGRLPQAGGMIGFNTLPSLSDWSSGDSVVAFDPEASYVGSNANPTPRPLPGPYPLPNGTLHGSGVLNGGNGRQAPFGTNGANLGGVATPSVEAGSLMLRAPVVDNRGVSFSQFPSGLSSVYAWDGHTYYNSETGDTQVDPPASEIEQGWWSPIDMYAGSFFRAGVTDVTVFLYEVTLDANNALDRVLTQSSSIPNEVYYGPSIGVMPTSRTFAENNLVQAAFVHVVPAPGAAALLGVAGFLAVRRRR